MDIFANMIGAGRVARSATDAALTEMRADRLAREVERSVGLMEDRFDRLVLICSAMWSLVREETDLTEDDLINRMRDLDLTDGRLDGKMPLNAAHCVACKRPMSPRHVRCIYCGSEKVRSSGFDDVK